MYGDGRPGRRRRQRHWAGCDADGRGTRGQQRGVAGEGRRLTSPSATHTFLALATSAAQDLRDRDGLARPLLRRGALRLSLSSYLPAQRLGAEYLRVDPATPEEFARLVPRMVIDGPATPADEAQEGSATRIALPPAPPDEGDGAAPADLTTPERGAPC